MKIGVTLPTQSWPDGRPWSFAEIAEYAIRADALGFDAAWASDHVFLEHDGGRRAGGPDPMTLLAYLAGRTRRIGLGTMVVCAAFRPPGQLVREARALAELSRERFTLGMGAGWHQAEFDAFGYRFDRRVSRFQEYVEAVIELLGGGRVDYEGRHVQLHGAEVFGGSAPPIWIAGVGPRMIQLAARYAVGWNGGSLPDRFPAQLEALRREESAAGRPDGSVVACGGAIALILSRGERTRLLAAHPQVAETVTIGGPERLRELVAHMRAAGCQHLVLHLSGGIWSSYAVEQLDRAAAALALPML